MERGAAPRQNVTAKPGLEISDRLNRPSIIYYHIPPGNLRLLALSGWLTTLTEAFRRAVLRLFVRRELLDGETAQGMLAWPHSGFHVHDGVWVARRRSHVRRPAGRAGSRPHESVRGR